MQLKYVTLILISTRDCHIRVSVLLVVSIPQYCDIQYVNMSANDTTLFPGLRSFWSLVFIPSLFHQFSSPPSFSSFHPLPHHLSAIRFGFILWLAQISSLSWETDQPLPTAPTCRLTRPRLLSIPRPSSSQWGAWAPEQSDFAGKGESWTETAAGKTGRRGPQPYQTWETGVVGEGLRG